MMGAPSPLLIMTAISTVLAFLVLHQQFNVCDTRRVALVVETSRVATTTSSSTSSTTSSSPSPSSTCAPALLSLDNVGLPTSFLQSVQCGMTDDDGLGRNRFPSSLPMQLFPENKMHLQPFPAPSLAASWQRSVIARDSNPMPQCDDYGVCDCGNANFIFNGHRCIPSWGSDPYKALRDRWAAAPLAASAGDVDIGPEFPKFWEEKAMFKDAWTTALAGQLRGKKVLDVGAGYARQSFVFALHGAYVTHLDVVPKNLERIRYLAKHYGIEDRVKTVYLEDLNSAKRQLEGEMFDAVLFFGSMHHMPREYIRHEAGMYFDHLKVGGLFVQLAYPSSRWYCNGRRTFPEFCASTDNSCPWAEWYDIHKALATFHPNKFSVLYAGVVGPQEFTWWALVYLGKQK